MKVLITGGKSALALKMVKAFVPHQLILADYGEMPNFSSSTYKFVSLGEKNEDTIAHTLLNNCLDEQVDLILPLQPFEVVAMAKAKVLFSEFNIDVVLPSTDDLATYFDANSRSKSMHWAIFKDGTPLFMSLPNEQLVEFGKTEQLNGAFYFNVIDSVANLTLITI